MGALREELRHLLHDLSEIEGDLVRSILPASIREKSRMSLMISRSVSRSAG